LGVGGPVNHQEQENNIQLFHRLSGCLLYDTFPEAVPSLFEFIWQSCRGQKGAKKGCSDWNTPLNNPPGLMYVAY
jgi:hypothetical protein